MRKGVKGHNHGNIVRKMSLRSVGQRSSCIATRRSDRGYSRKVQRMMRDLDREALMTRKETDSERKEKYQQRNWKQLSERELNKLTPVARSRYLAYEPASKELQDKQQESMRRIRERKDKQGRSQQDSLTMTQLVELERDSELVGQLKAAEARDRVKSLRKVFEIQQNMETRRLINNQPTSIEAVRLKTFLKPHPQSHTHLTSFHNPHTPDILTRSQRKRCEKLIEHDTR